MRNWKIGFFLIVLLVLAVAAGCKSTPETPAETPTETPAPPRVEQTAVPATQPPSAEDLSLLKEAQDRAAKAKQTGIDFQAPAYYTEEWNNASSLHAQVDSVKNTSDKSVVLSSTAQYNAAADAYEAIVNKSIAQYTEDQSAELLKARERAVKAGAEVVAEDYLLQADNVTAKAYEQNEAGDHYTARDTTFLARDMYETLETGLGAYDLRVELANKGFINYDPEAVDAIDSIAESALDDYEAGNITSAREKFEDVLVKYQEYRGEWMETYAGETALSAAEEKQRALDEKANIASRLEFEAANIMYDRAIKSFNENKFEEAASLYNRSMDMFETAAKSTVRKRGIAEEALMQADVKMIESDETANRADRILLGGNQ